MHFIHVYMIMDFPDSSVSKESTCNAGDPSLIPGSGRSAGEGIGYPLQYSWASLVAQLVSNPPAKQETWVWSLGWEDPLEKEMTTHSSILAWRIPWTEKPGRLHPMGSQRVGHDWITNTFTLNFSLKLQHSIKIIFIIWQKEGKVYKFYLLIILYQLW